MLELAIVTLASLVSGFVNSVAGGGGLIQIPVLFGVFPTAPPATLFGTSKAAMVWGTAWASGSYIRHVRLPLRTLLPAVVMALLGGLLGAWLVTQMSADWLRRLLPVMLTLVLVSSLWTKDLGRIHAPNHAGRREPAVASAIAGGLGVYDGFFGPGTGSFFIFLFIRVLGYDFLHAVAFAKILNTATNLSALVCLGLAGHVWWQYMPLMAVANVLGSFLGTRTALRHGVAFIRPMFLTVVAVLILKTARDAYLP
jgi:uncharacterized membrane protein YfcA